MPKGMFGNFFLLTHKCGNMFMEEVFRDEEISDSFFNLTRANIDRDDLSHLHIEKLMNVRCRGSISHKLKKSF